MNKGAEQQYQQYIRELEKENDILKEFIADWNTFFPDKGPREISALLEQSSQDYFLNVILVPWALNLGFATGHADTIEDLLAEVGSQIINSQKIKPEH
jgi:hypothetical protein